MSFAYDAAMRAAEDHECAAGALREELDIANGYLNAAREDVALLRVRSREAAATIDCLRAEIERLRGLLPAVAVVVCPVCGVDITADLDDDAEYITRRHSRRAPARIGLGEIVWCDGGIARAGGSRG